MCVHSFFGSLDQTLVVRQAQIVVCAEVQNVASCVYFDVGSLRSGDDTLVLIQSGSFDVCQFLSKEIFQFTVHNFVFC